MESISPTLALAALLFGISGNVNQSAQEASTDTSGMGCPDLAIADDSAQPLASQDWAEALRDAASSTVALPGVIDPKWTDSEHPAIEDAQPSADVAPADALGGSDPITRSTAPTAMGGPAENPDNDPCGSEL